jgi:hypothetical protein
MTFYVMTLHVTTPKEEGLGKSNLAKNVNFPKKLMARFNLVWYFRTILEKIIPNHLHVQGVIFTFDHVLPPFAGSSNLAKAFFSRKLLTLWFVHMYSLKYGMSCT